MSQDRSKAGGNKKERNSRRQKGKPQDEDTDPATCDTCAKIFRNENDKLLRCSWCESGWRCVKCLGYSDEQYNFLAKDDNMLFCCKTCVDPVVNQHADTQKFQTLMLKFMQEFSSKVNQVLLTLNNKVDKDEFDKLKGKVEELRSENLHMYNISWRNGQQTAKKQERHGRSNGQQTGQI